MADVVPGAQVAAALSAWVDSIPNTAKLKLYTNEVTPDADSVAGDFTEPTDASSWYTAKVVNQSTIAFGEVWKNSDGYYVRTLPSQQFNYTATSGAPAVTIRGWHLTDSAGTTLYAAGTITPKYLSGEYDSVIVSPSVAAPPFTTG